MALFIITRRRSLIATTLGLLMLLLLGSHPFRAHAKLGPISIRSVYTTDGAFDSATTFGPGDKINYQVDVDNNSGSEIPIDVRFQAFPNDYSPDPSLYRYDFTIHVDKMPVGLSRFYNPTSLPGYAPAYYSAIRITVTPSGSASPANDGDWGEGNFTIKPPKPMPRVPMGKASNLIVLVHGCCTDQNDLKEWDGLGNKISQQIADQANWEVVVWDWTQYTPKTDTTVSDALKAYYAAGDQGVVLAQAIICATCDYKHVHLIAHSAGAKLIDTATYHISLMKTIHLTFLDAFRPPGEDYGSSLGNYTLGHYAEHYVDKSVPSLPYTNDDLPHAFNFDVTNWQPAPSSYEKRILGHQWPRYWYDQSITMSGYKFGYNLSLEGGGSFTQLNSLATNWGSSPVACNLRSVSAEIPSSCDFIHLLAASPQ